MKKKALEKISGSELSVLTLGKTDRQWWGGINQAITGASLLQRNKVLLETLLQKH